MIAIAKLLIKYHFPEPFLLGKPYFDYIFKVIKRMIKTKMFTASEKAAIIKYIQKNSVKIEETILKSGMMSDIKIWEYFKKEVKLVVATESYFYKKYKYEPIAEGDREQVDKIIRELSYFPQHPLCVLPSTIMYFLISKKLPKEYIGAIYNLLEDRWINYIKKEGTA